MRRPRSCARRHASASSSSVSCAPSSRALKRSAPRYTASAPFATAARTASSEPAGASNSGVRRGADIPPKIARPPGLGLPRLLDRTLLHEPKQERGNDQCNADPPHHRVFASHTVRENADAGERARDLEHRYSIHCHRPPVVRRKVTRKEARAYELPRQVRRSPAEAAPLKTPFPAHRS